MSMTGFEYDHMHHVITSQKTLSIFSLLTSLNGGILYCNAVQGHLSAQRSTSYQKECSVDRRKCNLDQVEVVFSLFDFRTSLGVRLYFSLNILLKYFGSLIPISTRI